MNLKKFLLPSVLKLALLASISIFAIAIFYKYNVKFIPCLTKPISAPGEPVNFTSSICSLKVPFGIVVQFNFLSYVIIFFDLIFIPYIISCFISWIFYEKIVKKYKKNE